MFLRCSSTNLFNLYNLVDSRAKYNHEWDATPRWVLGQVACRRRLVLSFSLSTVPNNNHAEQEEQRSFGFAVHRLRDRDLSKRSSSQVGKRWTMKRHNWWLAYKYVGQLKATIKRAATQYPVRIIFNSELANSSELRPLIWHGLWRLPFIYFCGISAKLGVVEDGTQSLHLIMGLLFESI